MRFKVGDRVVTVDLPPGVYGEVRSINPEATYPYVIGTPPGVDNPKDRIFESTEAGLTTPEDFTWPAYMGLQDRPDLWPDWQKQVHGLLE